MSDEEEIECKLSYKEGREIRREVESKRMWKSLRWLIIGFLLSVFVIVVTEYDIGILFNGGIEALRMKVMEGDMQAVMDYIRYNSAINATLITFLMFTIMTIIELALTEERVKEALKEANDKKEGSS